jgi:hypothetical protein
VEKESDEEDREQVGGSKVGESQREVSWIWTVAGMTGTDTGIEDGEFWDAKK